jgi:hypothetical protein
MCGTLVRIWMSTGTKPRSVTFTPAASAPIFLPFGTRPDGLQHQVVELLLERALAFELHQDAVGPGLGADRLGLEQDVVEARRVELLPDLDQVAVGAQHQAVEHLDHVEPGAEGRVDRAHLEADDAAADDQHPLRLARQLERAGRGDDRVSSLGMNGSFTASEPAAMTARAKPIVVVPPAASSTLRGGRREAAGAGDDRDLPHLRHLRQAAGEPAHHLVLVRDELAPIDRRRAEADADLVRNARPRRARRRRAASAYDVNAADVEADAAERSHRRSDQHDLEAEVGGANAAE